MSRSGLSGRWKLIQFRQPWRRTRIEAVGRGRLNGGRPRAGRKVQSVSCHPDSVSPVITVDYGDFSLMLHLRPLHIDRRLRRRFGNGWITAVRRKGAMRSALTARNFAARKGTKCRGCGCWRRMPMKRSWCWIRSRLNCTLRSRGQGLVEEIHHLLAQVDFVVL